MFGVELGNPQMWKESGGLIVLCVVLLAANVAQFKLIAELMSRYVGLVAQYHEALTSVLDSLKELREGLHLNDVLDEICSSINERLVRLEDASRAGSAVSRPKPRNRT